MYDSFLNKHPGHSAGMNLMGTFFYWFFLARRSSRGTGSKAGRPIFFIASLSERFPPPSGEARWGLTAAALVAAVQAFVTGAAAHHDMAAYITGRGITLHALGSCIQGIQ